VQLVFIITKINPVHGRVYLIQHYVIKFVSDLRQVGCFLRGFSGFLHYTGICVQRIVWRYQRDSQNS
jgi:hypothetical protein